MRKIVFGLLLLIGALNLIPLKAQQVSYKELEAKPHFGAEANLTLQLLETFHYRKLAMNDSLSAVILNDYIGTLDNNKSYFLQSDIDEFQVYSDKIDDLLKASNVNVAYVIYDRFKARFDERMDYVYKTLLKYEFDFTLDETYESDRSELPYAKDKEELEEIWRKIIKSQVLSLKLNGKADSSINKTIVSRFDRFKKALAQYKSDDVFEIYMNSIAESFDPHTNYFSPKAYDKFQQDMSLSLEGIGARLQTDNDFTKVVEILPGGPAMKSDLIHPDDRIVGVGQGEHGEMVDVIGWRIDDVVQLIKGPKGTTVRLEILPAQSGIYGPSTTISLVRDKIKLEDMEAKAEVVPVTRNGVKYNFGVITLPGFYRDFEAYYNGDPNYNSTTRDVKRLIQELQTKKIDGLMIDLRNNGGGSLEEAIELTGLFIENGPVVQVKSSNKKVVIRKDEDLEINYEGPLTVMINRFSASASEIFAGAIQDYGRGVIIGETTFGKGTVQNVVDLGRYLNLPEGERAGQVKLTIQKFYRVTGSSTQHLGVHPDINFPSAFGADEFGESGRPSALPWDQIKSAKYDPVNKVSDKLITEISSEYKERLQTDRFLKELVEETEELKSSISKSTVSLNEEKRKKEIETLEKKRTERSANNNSIVEKEGIYEVKEIDVEDKYLREGLIILSDIVTVVG